jgi:putative ABC transport system permease protein
MAGACYDSPLVMRVAFIWLLLLAASSSPAPSGESEPRKAPADRPTILVSRQLAEARGLADGDVVTLARDREGEHSMEFRIVGIYEPVPDPVRLTARRLEARLHLPDLLTLVPPQDGSSTTDAVTAINIKLADPAEAREFARDFTTLGPGLVALPTTPGEGTASVFEALERFHFAIAMVTVVASTAFLLALMVMRAEERRETVGILRLIGFPKRHVLFEVLIEGSFIALAGAVFGVIFAATTEHAVNRFFQWRYDTALIFVHVTPGIVLRCLALALPLGVLAGVVASWTLLRRDVVALLRR